METNKLKQANIEKKRPLFLMIGTLFALTFTLVAFEWQTPWTMEEDGIIDCQFPILVPLIMIDPEPKMPDPPKPPTTSHGPVIDETILDETRKGGETKTGLAEDIDDLFPIDDIEEVDDSDGPICDLPFLEYPKARYNCLDENIAEEEMEKYLLSHIEYPIAAKKKGIEGTVLVHFIIDKEGRISDVKVVGKKLGFGCEEEALRVIKSMGDWCPAFHHGQMVASYYNLPVTFRLN